MYINWLVSKNDLKIDSELFKLKFANNEYQILFDQKIQDEQYYWDENNKEGVFIIGYLLPSIEYSEKVTPKSIIESYKENKCKTFPKYKGNYTIIIVLPDKIILVSDVFGISKFFYNNFIISNNFWIFKDYSNLEVSKEAIYLYSIFNYWIKDYTLYKDILKSEGGYYFEFNKIIIKKQYFDLKTFLRNREIKYDKHSTFKYAPEIWTGILRQYLDFFNERSISQTLTAGLDSRMILAGFQKLKFTPTTFTFGNDNSMDVVYAKKIAKSLEIPYHHFYPDAKFFDNFISIGREVLNQANGLSTIFRAHRFDAYRKLSKISDVVFFGFIGSEIIRGGVYPDGLIYPHFILDYWLGNKISIAEILKNKFIQIDVAMVRIIEQKIFDEFDFYYEPDTHIFETIVPLHFGQDIRLLESIGTKSVAPYWDIDFLNFQKSTPFFIDNKKKKQLSSLGHYKRMKGPVFSCKMIELLDPENADISLGKGYSPRDYNRSPNYAGIKFLLHKYFSKKGASASNFAYDKWFLESVKEMKENCDLKFIDESLYDNLLSVIYKTDEYGLLTLVNPINVSLTDSIMLGNNQK